MRTPGVPHDGVAANSFYLVGFWAPDGGRGAPAQARLAAIFGAVCARVEPAKRNAGPRADRFEPATLSAPGAGSEQHHSNLPFSIRLQSDRDIRKRTRRQIRGTRWMNWLQFLGPALFPIHSVAAASDALGSFGISTTSAGVRGGPSLSMPMQIALGLTLLTLLPAVIMCITPFLRIAVVLHFLRQALGTQTAPSNQVLVGLSLFLSLLIVQPMFSDIYKSAWQPLEQGQITADQAMDQGARPLRSFLVKFARERDIQLFLEIAKEPAPHNTKDLSLRVLIPAYILSELKAGFQIGAVLFLPFLVIDMAVASVTLSVGMMQLPPAMISAPFKILLFVLVDGWNLVVGSLMKSFLQ
jgi:flagellar biosynthesis protein FliP